MRTAMIALGAFVTGFAVATVVVAMAMAQAHPANACRGEIDAVLDVVGERGIDGPLHRLRLEIEAGDGEYLRPSDARAIEKAQERSRASLEAYVALLECMMGDS